MKPVTKRLLLLATIPFGVFVFGFLGACFVEMGWPTQAARAFLVFTTAIAVLAVSTHFYLEGISDE